MDHPVLRVERVERSRQDGQAHQFIVLHSPAWVNIVPVTPEGRVVLIRQWRQGSQAPSLEIPGGLVDPGESPEAAAARELLEETGYASPGLVHLGKVNPNPALFDNTCHTYLAPQAVRVAEPRLDDTENIEVLTVPGQEVPGLVRRGEIDHSLVLAALCFHWLAQGWPPEA